MKGTLLRLLLLVLAFVAGGTIMTLELLAPRLVAPHLGTTALVWTATLGTFLGGLAWGNAVGGRLADRGAPLALLLLAGSAAAALVVPLDDVLSRLLRDLPHVPRAMITLPALFLPAAFALGLAPPALARRLLDESRRPGRALGALAAAGALGSVAGTFLAGFVLVPRFGLRALTFATAGVLAVFALASLAAGRTREAPPDEAAAASPPVRVAPKWVLLAALAGAALLVLEVHAGRAAAMELGASLYAWTSVIGVALAALAGGNLLGGWLADRLQPRAALGPALAAAGAASLLGLWAPALMKAALALPGPGPSGSTLAYPLRTLLAVALPYALPAFLVGTLSPVVVRAALEAAETRGRVVGRLYAAGTLGAVLAAATTGTWWIPLLGRDGVLLILAGGLAAAAIPFAWRWGVFHLALVGAAALLVLAPVPALRSAATAVGLEPPPANGFARDSRYFHVKVLPSEVRWAYAHAAPDLGDPRDAKLLEGRAWWAGGRRALYWDVEDPTPAPMSVLQRAWLSRRVADRRDRGAVDTLYRLSRQRVRLLRLDRLIHSYVNLDDPAWLGYDYEHLYDRIVARVAEKDAPLRAFFLGGGGYSFQRHLLATRGEELRIVTAEIDPVVTAMAREHLALEEDARHVVRHEDARTVIGSRPPDAPPFDLVFGDAFNDLAVPFHLTTVEFARALRQHMTPRGVYMINVIDVHASGRFVGAFTATLRGVFAHVAVLTTGSRTPNSQDTFVVVASDRPLQALLEGLGGGADDPFRVHRHEEAEIARWIRNAGGVVLTDDHAPVEALLAPVVEARDTDG